MSLIKRAVSLGGDTSRGRDMKLLGTDRHKSRPHIASLNSTPRTFDPYEDHRYFNTAYLDL